MTLWGPYDKIVKLKGPKMNYKLVFSECTCANDPGIISPQNLYFFDKKDEKKAIMAFFTHKTNQLNGKLESLYWSVHINGKHLMAVKV